MGPPVKGVECQPVRRTAPVPRIGHLEHGNRPGGVQQLEILEDQHADITGSLGVGGKHGNNVLSAKLALSSRKRRGQQGGRP
jgi:hypothetical protein